MPNDKHRILVVDDEQDLCDIVSVNLTLAGYEVSSVFSAEEALKTDLPSYSLFILDVMMPGLSGFQLAKMLKSNKATSDIPVIFLTAKDTEDDLLKGFSIGADDYIQKPFSVRELTARVKAVLQRSNRNLTDNNQSESSGIVSFEGIVIDSDRKRVEIDGEIVAFTPTEFLLLRLLMIERGQVFSRQQLIEQLWPDDVIVTNRTIDVNINRIRKKIGKYAKHLATRQGFGYCFED